MQKEKKKKEKTHTHKKKIVLMKSMPILWSFGFFCQNLDSIRRQYFSGVMMKNRAIMHGIFKS